MYRIWLGRTHACMCFWSFLENSIPTMISQAVTGKCFKITWSSWHQDALPKRSWTLISTGVKPESSGGV